MLHSYHNEDDQNFVLWKYRVGQRLQLHVPVETFQQQIVLPVGAVTQEGAEWFAFQQNGSSFIRVPVHVVYRDARSVVIANDGSLFPGDVVALKSAHQLHLAIKSESAPAVDPHAGHNH